MLLSYKLRFRSSFLPSRDCHERVNKQLFKWLFFGVRLLMVHVVQSALESRRGFVEACDSITSLRHLRLSCFKEGRNSWIPSCQQTRTWPLWLYLHWDSPLKSSNFNRKKENKESSSATQIFGQTSNMNFNFPSHDSHRQRLRLFSCHIMLYVYIFLALSQGDDDE